ncbi:MAG: hypothetical protein E3J29_06650 [Dehalococcoidia bacterium]|nr:MAG: hypothetical protein E3J29_06650 [Dehalococcoidia bacterium]
MSVILDADSIRACTLGTIVQRATATLPAGTDGALFTITGGQILLLAFWGEVTTAIQNQANATKLKFNPTATGADQDLCATLDIDNDAVGEIYSITGTVGDAMVSDLLIGNVMLQDPLLLSEGDIELDCAATNTGSVAWNMIYVSLDSAGTVAAA